MKKYIFLSIFVCLYSGLIYADKFAANDTYTVCFTPGGYCEDDIVSAINQAKKKILVQTFVFTSKPIMQALLAAKNRGLDVEIIYDKLQFDPSQPWLNAIASKDIPSWVDYKPRNAHNKVIIIDDTTVITGSYNFTHGAQNNNAENLLIIKDPGLAKQYSDNWYRRKQVSTPAANYTYSDQANDYHKKQPSLLDALTG